MRRLDSVPWARRSQVRHIMQQLTSAADQFRTDMLHGELNADGALADIQRMQGELEAAARLLREPGVQRSGQWDGTLASCVMHRRRVQWQPWPAWWLHDQERYEECSALRNAPSPLPQLRIPPSGLH